MDEQLRAYLKRLESLRRWVRSRQDTDRGMVTFREVAKRYGVGLDTVEIMVSDALLSYNVGIMTGAGHGVFANRGDYTIEDLNEQEAHA